jgi:hypothetical protein
LEYWKGLELEGIGRSNSNCLHVSLNTRESVMVFFRTVIGKKWRNWEVDIILNMIIKFDWLSRIIINYSVNQFLEIWVAIKIFRVSRNQSADHSSEFHSKYTIYIARNQNRIVKSTIKELFFWIFCVITDNIIAVCCAINV